MQDTINTSNIVIYTLQMPTDKLGLFIYRGRMIYGHDTI